MTIDVSELIKYEIDGAVCYWAGDPKDLPAHIAKVKKARKKSPNVVTLNKTGSDLKVSREENRRYNVLSLCSMANHRNV